MIQEPFIISKPSIESEPLTEAEESGYTYLHCVYFTSPKFHFGWWVNIWKTSYLLNPITVESVSLLEAINIPLAPQRHYLKKFGDSLRFVLVFPPLPAHWESFDFVEHCRGEMGLSASNILRNNTGVYKVVLK